MVSTGDLVVAHNVYEVSVRPGVSSLVLFAYVGPDTVGHAEMVVVDLGLVSDEDMVAAVFTIPGGSGYLAEAALEIRPRPRRLALVDNVYVHPEWRGRDLGRTLAEMLGGYAGGDDAAMVYLPWPADLDEDGEHHDRSEVFAAAARLQRLWAGLGASAVPGRAGCWWTTQARIRSSRSVTEELSG